MQSVKKLIILGSGPAGLTAGIYAARASLQPVIFEGPNPGGQLMSTSFVENWPGEEKILGADLMIAMREHAQRVGSKLVQESIEKVDLSQRPFTIWTKQNTFQTHALIIATGATAKKLGCPGEEDYWAKGVTTCAICDGPFYKDKQVIVVGGGDTAMEDATFMTRYSNKITIIHIKDALTASVAMQKPVLENKNITILYNSSISEIHGNGSHLTEITIHNYQTNQKKTLPADVLFVAIGLIPNTKLFKPYLALNDYGYLQVTAHTQTSLAGIFAAGDVIDDRYRQAITSAGSGCMAALDAERYLKNLNL